MSAWKACLIASVVLAGCGSSTSGTSTKPAKTDSSAVAAVSSPAGPSRASFITSADAICSSVTSRIAPLKASINSNSTPAQAADATSHVLTIEASAVQRLKALPEPSGDHAVIAKLWTALDALVANQQNVQQALADDSASELTAAEADVNRAQSYYRGLAQGYGLQVCGASTY